MTHLASGWDPHDDDFAVPLTRGEAVAQRLREEILTGQLPPGAPLRDAELASRLGVSITPVRESVATLMAEGLVEALPNKRRRVSVLTQRQAEELSDLLGTLLIIAVERLPLPMDDDAEISESPVGAVAAAARLMAQACRSDTRDTAESSYRTFASTLFRATGHTELIRVAVPTLRRTLSMFRQFPVEGLLPTWAAALDELADHLDDLEGAEDRSQAEAARKAATERTAQLVRDVLALVHDTSEDDGAASAAAADAADDD
ncbi:GntR family transcriptional regulator [Nesterenkonia sp. PF2B19]|uniref:GntR family transcriptional regulator n=1 Tax=unclassified Nesterenkonia TaxID=2629769 RepID=UPI000872EB57|nr:GntR family transcriptional regulator [Nesterenkonia sp. PF2B19]OSM43320.1 hypothetical protein BCY76_009120 [Nesterenkonia sp. PF2B19]